MEAFTLRQLECLVAVVEERSVTAAARRLHLTAGAVSMAIRDLEGSLGVQLAVRLRGKGTSVTEVGRLVYERAHAALAEADAVRAVARPERSELSGAIRLGCATTLSPWLIPRIVAHFAHHHPLVDVRFVEASASILTERLHAGELDALLIYAHHPSRGIVRHPFGPAHLHLVVSPDHRLAALDVAPLNALEGERAILLAVEPSISFVEGVLRRAGLTPDIAWKSVNVETIRSMVGHGLGYSIVMGRPFGDRTYEGLPLTYIPIADPLPAVTVVLAVAQGVTLNRRLEYLLDLCRREFGGPDALVPIGVSSR